MFLLERAYRTARSAIEGLTSATRSFSSPYACAHDERWIRSATPSRAGHCCIMTFMEALKVRVENGKIVGDAPRGIAEGTELELCLAAPQKEMSEEELVALQGALDAGWRSMEAGRYRPAAKVIIVLVKMMFRVPARWR